MPLFRKRKKIRSEIQPDEILIDSANVAELDRDRFEGRIERPLDRNSFVLVGLLLGVVALLYIGRAFDLQFLNGVAYATQAAENKLAESVVFADRGIITDRNGKELAFNNREAITDDFALRQYAAYQGVAHVVGYTKAPAKDTSGFYFRDSYTGVDGAEQVFNTALSGQNGLRLTETDARGKVVSESLQRAAVPGKKVALSIDAEVTEGLYQAIADRAEKSGFQGGSGIIMDIHTGEIISLTSYPEYSSAAVSSGNKDALQSLLSDKRQPFLDRAITGLYTPGSIVKPIMALAALNEGVIDEYKQILSTGSISIPNPYDKTKPSVFRDWKAHGLVDMRHAIAVSSDVYFYEVGGGFQDQKGIGITKIDQYFKMFGFGAPTGIFGMSEPAGTIPTPEWKEKNFNGDPWRVGDTYNTSIGQYGVQVTPLQAVRAIAAIANSGKLLVPTLLASSSPQVAKQINFPEHYFDVVREGMHMSVEQGTAIAVNLPFIEIGGKTGTAQTGVRNEFINSWTVGFFPYDNPKYAYVMVLERGPANALVGATPAMSQFFWWLNEHAPQYLK